MNESKPQETTSLSFLNKPIDGKASLFGGKTDGGASLFGKKNEGSSALLFTNN
jgi:hypothetical protein